MESIIELHRTNLREIEEKAVSGVTQLRDFANLMLEKVEWEKAAARASKKLSTFDLKSLSSSNYGKIFIEMINVSESRSIQAYDLAK